MGLNNNVAKALASNAGISTALKTAKVLFGKSEQDSDWRVKLSFPKLSEFDNNSILFPLKATNGFVFPYTPQITLSGTANYESIAQTHINYPFNAYRNSEPGRISIVGDFYVENESQAQYWIAGLHYFRSITKMFAGENTGNPPVIVKLNGYGDHIFKNIPVAVSSFSISLPPDVDYIEASINPLSTAMNAVGSYFDSAGKITKKLGSNSVGNTLSKIGTLSSATSGIAGKAASLLSKNFSSGITYVPVKSTFTIDLLPMYSREKVRNFNMQSFIKGDYAKGDGGFI